MNIKLKYMEWSNMFSYGENNKLDFTLNPITQLDAINGSGKTTLVLILQEVLESKNIQGFKKGDILNRYSNKDSWNAKLWFDINSNEYELSVTRKGDTSKVVLFENKINISKHKIPDTYKHLLTLLGGSYDVLNQLMYQSSDVQLEFLKATDTNRKKFLVSLFNLAEYLQDGEIIKAKAIEVEKKLLGLQGEDRTVKDFLNQATLVTEKKFKRTIPIISEDLKTEIRQLESDLTNYNKQCLEIDKNNLLIQEQSSIKFDIDLQDIDLDMLDSINTTLNNHQVDYNTRIRELEQKRNRLKTLNTDTHCHVCKQPIDNTHTIAMSNDLNSDISRIGFELNEIQDKIIARKREIKNLEEKHNLFLANQRKIERFEQLFVLINKTLPTKYPNNDQIKNELSYKKVLLGTQISEQLEATKYNTEVDIFNAKLEVIVRQKREFLTRQELITSDIINTQLKLDRLTVLRKAFSPTGIVAYKLENIIKNFESEINEYLVELSDGQFQINFRLEGEKLNVIIYSHGLESPIETISKGEFNRVQVSTLLAIRKLLSKMSGIQINFLFLDEVFGTLDMQGKERFIEILQKEENTNTFIVAHDWSHPLVPKLSILKENNISRIL